MRDPKAMAQTLRDDLAAKAIRITHSESLEILSHMFGHADWNTMAAIAKPSPAAAPAATYPALPLRDTTILPVYQFPLWLKREKTLRALDEAFRIKRQIVIVTQKSASTEDPGPDDLYTVGVLARVIDIRPPAESTIAIRPELAGSTEVLFQPIKRVRLLSFEGDGGAYRATVQEPDEGPIVTAPELVKSALSAFDRHLAAKGISAPQQLLTKSPMGDAGHFADLMTMHSLIPGEHKQELLEMFEPVPRLQRLIAILEAA